MWTFIMLISTVFAVISALGPWGQLIRTTQVKCVVRDSAVENKLGSNINETPLFLTVVTVQPYASSTLLCVQ